MGHHESHAVRALSPQARGAAVSGSLPRTLGFLYSSGAAVALLWTALPHSPDRGDGVVVVMALLALVLGGALVRCGPWLAEWLLHLALGGIQLVIGIAYVAGGDPTGDVRLFFLWATPYAALHCSVRAALAHLLWTSTVFITCLAVMPDATHRAAWAIGLMLLGTLFATAVLAASAATAAPRRVRPAARGDARRPHRPGEPATPARRPAGRPPVPGRPRPPRAGPAGPGRLQGRQRPVRPRAWRCAPAGPGPAAAGPRRAGRRGVPARRGRVRPGAARRGRP
jgi:hypothetical protein